MFGKRMTIDVPKDYVDTENKNKTLINSIL